MSATRLVSARAAAAGVVRYRLAYLPLRLRPTTQRTPVALLVELGFDPDRVAALDEDFNDAADELFPALAERAVAAGEGTFASKLAQRGLAAHESKRLVYLAVRLGRPETVIETGTFTGALSTFVLRGLEDNGSGRLVSLDVPARMPIPHAIDVPLPAGHDPGWAIPDALRSRLTLVSGDARATLPRVLAEAGEIDMFLHDSLHTTRHMLFEYGRAWRYLRPGGLLVSDDVFLNPSFWWFTRRRGVPFLHIGNVGAIRKPLGHRD